MSSPEPRVLLVDPDEKSLRALAERLQVADFEVECTPSASTATDLLHQRMFDLAIVALELPEEQLHPLRDQLRETDPNRPVLWLTAPALDPGEAAREHGLSSGTLLVRPVRGDSLLGRIDQALESARVNRLLAHGGSALPEFEALLGSSPCWVQTLHLARRMARTDSTICVLGKTGTGKSTLVQAIHQASRRSRHPLVTAVVPTGQPERQLDDLFGHRPGAYTGADTARNGFFRSAHHGTLFLDEVADLSPEVQTALLRVLQEGCIRPLGSDDEIEIDVRVIVATNKDLNEEVAAGRFREDLFYRLDALTLRLPDLAERREDIVPLAKSFVATHSEQNGVPALPLSTASEEVLRAHPWSGNVRELDNRIKRGVLLSEGCPRIEPEHCGLVEPAPASRPEPESLALEDVELGEFLERAEREYLRKLLEKPGNKTELAARAGIHPATLRDKLNKHGLTRRE